MRDIKAYPHIGKVLSAVGYDAVRLKALQTTINGADVDIVVSAARPTHPSAQARQKGGASAYEFAQSNKPKLSSISTPSLNDNAPREGT